MVGLSTNACIEICLSNHADECVNTVASRGTQTITELSICRRQSSVQVTPVISGTSYYFRASKFFASDGDRRSMQNAGACLDTETPYKIAKF